MLRLLGVAGLLAWAGLAGALEPQPPQLVSVRWLDGSPAGGLCGSPRFSPNNRYLSFGCLSSDLVPEDDNDRSDTFLFDRVTGEIVRVSVTSLGEEVRYDSFGGTPSNSGDQVVFTSMGPLHPDAGPSPPIPDAGRSNVFQRRHSTGTTDLLTRDANGAALISPAGLEDATYARSEIMFLNDANLFVSPMPDPGNAYQVWIRNWQTGTIELLSRTPAGDLSNGGGNNPSFSANGRHVVFDSPADDLGPPARLGDSNLYARDRQTGAIERLTYPWQGVEFNEAFSMGLFPARITTNGRHVVFETHHPEIHPDASLPGSSKVYVLDRQTGGLELISRYPDHASLNSNADISDDGRYVAWATRTFGFDPPPNPTADHRAIWVLDRQTGQRVNVTAPLGPLYRDSFINLDLSPDGSAIAFTWRVGDPNQPQLFDRTLLYTVDLRGPQPPGAPPIPVPAGRFFGWAILSLLMAMATWRRRHLNV